MVTSRETGDTLVSAALRAIGRGLVIVALASSAAVMLGSAATGVGIDTALMAGALGVGFLAASATLRNIACWQKQAEEDEVSQSIGIIPHAVSMGLPGMERDALVVVEEQTDYIGRLRREREQQKAVERAL